MTLALAPRLVVIVPKLSTVFEPPVVLSSNQIAAPLRDVMVPKLVMVLPTPITLMGSPLFCVPFAWTLAPRPMVSVPFEPNSIVFGPVFQRPVLLDALLVTEELAPSVITAPSPSEIAFELPTAICAPELSVTVEPFGAFGPAPMRVVHGLGAPGVQVTVAAPVGQFAQALPPDVRASNRPVRSA